MLKALRPEKLSPWVDPKPIVCFVRRDSFAVLLYPACCEGIKSEYELCYIFLHSAVIEIFDWGKFINIYTDKKK